MIAKKRKKSKAVLVAAVGAAEFSLAGIRNQRKAIDGEIKRIFAKRTRIERQFDEAANRLDLAQAALFEREAEE